MKLESTYSTNRETLNTQGISYNMFQFNNNTLSIIIKKMEKVTISSYVFKEVIIDMVRNYV